MLHGNTMSLRKRLLQDEEDLVVWGGGYTGFSDAAFFAKHGVTVLIVDLDPSKVDKINRGQPPYPEIQHWLGFDLKPFTKLIRATMDWREAVEENHPVQLVCVNTEKDGGTWDGPLKDVCQKITKVSPTPLTIIESTLTPGWTDSIVRPILGNYKPVAVAPRRDWFTLQGMSLETLDRVVGATSDAALAQAIDVLGIVSQKIHVASNYRVAEMVKSVENAYRHLGISFAYQLSLAYPRIDIREVLELAGTKWNMETYYPSIGVGGYCLGPGTLIATTMGHKPIEKVKPGDLVLSDDGYTPVLNIMERQYSGELIGIDLSGVPRFWITPEHPILTSEGWKTVQELNTHSLLASPRVPREQMEEFMGQKLDYELGSFVGWYAAEGSRASRNDYSIGLTFNKKESDVAEKIATVLESRFECPTWYHKNGGHFDLRFKRKEVHNFLIQLIGDGASTKRLSQEVLSGPSDFKLGLLNAWTQGDGLPDYPREGRHRGCSISLSLIQGLQMLATSLEFPAYVSRIRNQGITKQGWNCSDMWQINWKEDRAWGKRNIPFEEGRRLRSTKMVHQFPHMQYQGPVYNLHTANNKYAVYDILIHNCIPLSPQYVLSGTVNQEPLSLLREAEGVDWKMPTIIADQLINKGFKKICILGLAYKGDLKVHVASASIRLAASLRQHGINAVMNDPLYTDDEVRSLSGCEPVKFPEGMSGCDCVVIACDHGQYSAMPKKILYENLKGVKLVLDSYGIWKPLQERLKVMDVQYHAVGDSGWLI